MEKCGQSVGLKKWGTWSYMGLRKRTLAIASRSSFEIGLIFDIHINLIMPTTLPLPSLLPCFPREKKPWPFAKVGNPAGDRRGGVLSVNVLGLRCRGAWSAADTWRLAWWVCSSVGDLLEA